MKVITKTVTNTEFTEEEINALETLSNIDCCGVLCSKCPIDSILSTGHHVCISMLASRILYNNKK